MIHCHIQKKSPSPWQNFRSMRTLNHTFWESFCKSDVEPILRGRCWVCLGNPHILPASLSLNCPKCLTSVMCHSFFSVAPCWGKAVLDRKGNSASVSHMHGFYSSGTHGHWWHCCALRNLTVQASRITSVSLPLLLLSSNPGILGHVPYAAVHPCPGQLGTCSPLASLPMPVNQHHAAGQWVTMDQDIQFTQFHFFAPLPWRIHVGLSFTKKFFLRNEKGKFS